MTDSKNPEDESQATDVPDSDVPDSEGPEIIVDSDWKAQVAKEKAAASDLADTSKNSDDDFVPKQVEADTEEIPPPPATFEILISMMFTQAMTMLGQIPAPTGEKMPVNKPFAKHSIDTLEMLGEKTEGNLSDDEANMLKEALHALRMAFVNTKA